MERPDILLSLILWLIIINAKFDNWDKLKEYFKEKTDGNTHKISRIHIQKIPKNKKIFQNDYSKDRVAMRKSIFDMGHKDIFCEGKLGRSIRIGARYKLKA
ncbi:hypothetical protein HpCHN105_07010 [Helicobacter pylori]